MRLSALLACLVLVVGVSVARADDQAAIAAVNQAAEALDAAFERQDFDAVKRMMPPDHIAVTPYYGAPQTVADQIETLSDLKYSQTVTSEVATELLAPDVALRTFTATFDGTFKGKPIAPHVFITGIWVKRDGAWLEKFYQVTALKSE